MLRTNARLLATQSKLAIDVKARLAEDTPPVVSRANPLGDGDAAIDVRTNFVGAEVAPVPDHVLTIGPNANDTVTQAVNFVNTKTTERPSTGTCPVSLSSSVVGYRYIRLENPSAADKLVDVSGDDPLDSVIAAYPGPDGPLSGARGNCLTTVNDFCPTAAGIATADSCLTGLTVPAMGSIVVYYSPYSTVTFGAATLRVTTKN